MSLSFSFIKTYERFPFLLAIYPYNNLGSSLHYPSPLQNKSIDFHFILFILSSRNFMWCKRQISLLAYIEYVIYIGSEIYILLIIFYKLLSHLVLHYLVPLHQFPLHLGFLLQGIINFSFFLVVTTLKFLTKSFPILQSL